VGHICPCSAGRFTLRSDERGPAPVVTGFDRFLPSNGMYFELAPSRRRGEKHTNRAAIPLTHFCLTSVADIPDCIAPATSRAKCHTIVGRSMICRVLRTRRRCGIRKMLCCATWRPHLEPAKLNGKRNKHECSVIRLKPKFTCEPCAIHLDDQSIVAQSLAIHRSYDRSFERS
jgi:hypothetical protein